MAPSHGVAEEQSRCRPGDRSRDEAFRDLFGKVVLVRAPSKCMAKALEADLRPWRDLEPSDVEHLSSDEVCHYEKLLRLSSKRGRPERLTRLLQLAQRNTLPYAAQDSTGDIRSGGPPSLCAFLSLPDEQQQTVGAAELKRLERLAFLADNEFLSLNERRDRLVELLREARSGDEQVLKTRSLASFLAAGAAVGGRNGARVESDDATAAEAAFAVGQKVQRRDDGEDWGTGYVISVDPLLVTVFGDLSVRGHEWDEVRHIPAEVPASPASQ